MQYHLTAREKLYYLKKYNNNLNKRNTLMKNYLSTNYLSLLSMKIPQRFIYFICFYFICNLSFVHANTYHYETKKLLDQRVNWNQDLSKLTPVETLKALSNTNQKTIDLPLLLHKINRTNKLHSIEADNQLSIEEKTIINQAAVIYAHSFKQSLPLHEFYSIQQLRFQFINALKLEFETVSISHKIDEFYLSRYYQDDPIAFAIYSVALSIHINKYGKKPTLDKLNEIPYSRNSTSLRDWFIKNHFSRRKQISQDVEAWLLNQLSNEITEWFARPKLDSLNDFISHPYARISAILKNQNELASIYPSTQARISLKKWNQALNILPNVSMAYSIIGQGIVNDFKETINVRLNEHPTLSLWSSLSHHDLFNIRAVSSSFIAETLHPLGSTINHWIKSPFNPLTYLKDITNLVVKETSLAENSKMSLEQSIEHSLINDVQVIGEEIRPYMHHYLGVDALAGIDVVIQLGEQFLRARQFPNTNEYALFEGHGNFGRHRLTYQANNRWSLKNNSQNSAKNWTTSGEHRYSLLIGRGQPQHIFSHYAKNIQHRYGVPAKNLFSDGNIASSSLSELFPKANNNQLAHLRFSDRLDLIAHGSPYGPVGHGQCSVEHNLSASELALQLFQLGLRELGVLKLQSCNTGGGFYLNQLKNELEKLSIRVGFLSAPTGYLMQLPGLTRTVLNPFPTFSKDRYEVIKTGYHLGFNGTRYQ